MEVHIDGPSFRMGTRLFCRNGLARTSIDAIWGAVDHHRRADESRPSDRYVGWNPQQWIWAFAWQAPVDSRSIHWFDGDVTESDVRLGRFQQTLDRCDMECQFSGNGPLAKRSSQMDLLQHLGQLRSMVISVHIFVQQCAQAHDRLHRELQ